MSETSFGYRTVPEETKEGLVGEVFSSVARRYDLMNDLMSGGVHRFWKDAMVEWLNPQAGQDFIDVAGGTGDIAFRIDRALAARGRRPGRIAVCDINLDMLSEGIRRGIDRNQVCWLCSNAMRLPFPKSSFDAYTIAFGIRNVTRINEALAEACRVLKPGGRFLCLEFSRVDAPGLDAIYEAYSFAVLPRLGRLIADDENAYRYLAESIRRFPSQGAFARMIEQAGLSRVKVRNLSGGIAALHSAWKL
jgi:demethylmenaquinone methyltransferase/2-methoxy-6-polyprenyl-1,4-benzoquinol methylase